MRSIAAVLASAFALAFSADLHAQFTSPPRADSTVRQLITRLAQRDTTSILLQFDQASLAAHGINRDSLLRLLLQGFDIGTVRKAELIDRTEFHPFNATRVEEQLAYHVVGERDSRLVFVHATSDSGRLLITGIRWQQAPRDLRQINAFKFTGKSWLHYVILTLAILIPLFSIVTAIAAARSRARFKWVWAVASLISIGKIAIAWSEASGVRFTPINLQLLGAGYVKYPLYAPWVISIGLPAFALAFWIFGRRQAPKTPDPQPVAA